MFFGKNLKSWWMFIVPAALYVFLSLIVNSTRLQNFALFDTLPFYEVDYRRYVHLTAIISSGVSPWDNNAYCYKGVTNVPLLMSQYAMYIMLNALVSRLTVQSAEATVTVIMPFLTTIFLVLSCFMFGRKMKLSKDRTALFFILVAFVSDRGLYFLTYPKGETLGICFSIVGLSYFLNDEYLKSVVPLSLAAAFGLMNLAIVAILFFYFLLTIIEIDIESSSTTIFRITGFGIKHFSWKKPLSLFMTVVLVLVYVSPILMPVQINWANALDPPPNKPDAVIKPDVTKPYVENPFADMIKATASAEWIVSRDLCPSTLTELMLIFAYPATYLYWGYVQRSTHADVLELLNINYTLTDAANLKHFIPTLSNFIPLVVAIWMGCGLPILFLYTAISTDSKNRKLSLLFVSTYLLPIAFALFYYVFHFSFFPQRALAFVELALSVCIAMSAKSLKKWQYLIIFILVARLVVWTFVVSSVRGF